MHVERLTKLAELLDRVEAEKKPFDIGVWYFPKRSAECGYVACAIGHATVDPRFTNQGLVKSKKDIPSYKNENSFFAVARFFDLSEDDTTDLFSGSGYKYVNYAPTAAQVARKIRRYIKKNTTE